MTVFLIGDTHFGHQKMVDTFKLSDGSFARGRFRTVEEMDEFMIAEWNRVVRPSDHVYHLGDVAMKQQDIDRIMPRLHGHKRLVRGNHDIFKTKQYTRWFDEIHGMRVLDGLIFTHAPLAPWSLGKQRANVHGHVHSNRPLLYKVETNCAWTGTSRFTQPFDFGRPSFGQPDASSMNAVGHYVNLSAELINYCPVSLEVVSGWVKSWWMR